MILAPLLAVLLGTASQPAAVQEVRVTSGDATLGGLLRLPAGPPPHPAVVLLPGSRATAKEDERLAAVAAAFVARGFAALTTDSRGMGASQGDFHAASLDVLARDAAAAAAMLRRRPDVRGDAVGFWGVSQGATWVGPLAAERSAAAFLVAASGPLLSPEDFMHRFFAARLRADQDLDEPTLARITASRTTVWRYLATGQGYEAASAAVEAARGEPWFASSGLPPTVRPPGELTALPAPTKTFLGQKDFDPVAAVARLPCPALFVYGAEDTHLPAAEHAATLRDLASRPGARISVEIVPGLDHDLQPARAGAGGATSAEPFASMARWAETQITAPRDE